MNLDKEKEKSGTSFNNKSVDSVVKLFEKTSVFKSLNKIVFLAVVVSLATGIYVFVDQILMVRILPLNPIFKDETFFDFAYNSQWKQAIDIIRTQQLNIQTSVASIIRTSISLSSPLTLICTAITLMLGLGISINYSKMLGKQDYTKAKVVWNNGFFLTLITSLVTSAILIGLTFFVVPIQSKTTNIDSFNLTGNDKILVQDFVNYCRDLSITWAKEYALILIGFNVFNCFTMVFISLLNSEGKNGIPTAFILTANVINIGLDVILLLFTKLGISGAAIATSISWIASTSIFLLYIYILNKKNDTLLQYKSLNIKNFRFDKSIVIFIFAIGMSSLFRNASTAIFSLVQQSIYGSITNQVTGLDNSYYLTILGAVSPIYNLFYSAIIGIIRGARTVITYNHAKNNIDNVKKAYWMTMVMSLAYALIFFILVCFALPKQFLWLFDILPENDNFNDASKLLMITMAQLVLLVLAISGMLYFQSTGKPITSLITSIAYGIIFGIPGLFIARAIAVATGNIDCFVFAPLAIMGVSGIVVCGYSSWYLYLRKEKQKDTPIDIQSINNNESTKLSTQK
ncbi:MATE family efflux transporter [Malacoplasma muris]|uniref:MATE family efflux transporter n=1 Tax=Malacoplasma muris TaxID=2119 RepID=UPI00398E58BE